MYSSYPLLMDHWTTPTIVRGQRLESVQHVAPGMDADGLPHYRDGAQIASGGGPKLPSIITYDTVYCLNEVNDTIPIGQIFDYKNGLHVDMSFVPFI